jgi:membrane-associated phospholipid phosphatase
MLAAAACATAFATVFVLAYHVPAGRSADGDIVRTLTDLNTSRLGTLASIAAHSTVIVIPLAACALAGFAYRAGRRREALAAVAIVVVALFSAEVLKLVLDQPRLRLALGLQQAGAYDFPSGHATAATALAFAGLLAARPSRRWLVFALGAAYAAAVCGSLVILGWHLASDVAGGVLLSSFCFCAAVAVLRFKSRRAAPGAAGSEARQE